MMSIERGRRWAVVVDVRHKTQVVDGGRRVSQQSRRTV
jgi:hypothetical protein